MFGSYGVKIGMKIFDVGIYFLIKKKMNKNLPFFELNLYKHYTRAVNLLYRPFQGPES